MATMPVTYANWTSPFEIAVLEARPEVQSVYHTAEALDAFLHSIWTHFRRVPKLQLCTQESIRHAVITLALSGLDIRQPGEVWLIPHENSKKDKKDKNGKYIGKELEVVVWDGYVGRIKLARQHPDILDVVWDVVRKGDRYQFRGILEHPQHEYPEGFQERGEIQGAYAVVLFRDGRQRALQMDKASILQHRDQYSRGRDGTIWQEYIDRGGQKVENRSFEKMAAKTVITQLCHPRNIPMPRVALDIIGQQERVLESLRPVTGEDMQPQAPVAASPKAIGEIWGDPDAEVKAALLEQIREQFSAAIVSAGLSRSQRAIIGRLCFGCSDWKELPALPFERLQQGMERWNSVCEKLTMKVPPPDTDDQNIWFVWLSMPTPGMEQPPTEETPLEEAGEPVLVPDNDEPPRGTSTDEAPVPAIQGVLGEEVHA